jgi:hypothetical protein
VATARLSVLGLVAMSVICTSPPGRRLDNGELDGEGKPDGVTEGAEVAGATTTGGGGVLPRAPGLRLLTSPDDVTAE